MGHMILDGVIQVYNESLSLLNSFQAHTLGINRIKQSPFNSNHVSTCSSDTTVKIWNISSCNTNWTLIRDFTNHTNEVFGLEWINEDMIASGGYDKTINIWSIVSGEIFRTINANEDFRSLKLLSNGFYLACGLQYGTINIYDINNNASLISSLSGHTYFVNDIVQISDDLLASSGSWDNFILVWNLTTNSPKFNLAGHTSSVFGLKLISSDVLASGAYDMTIKLWNITNEQLIQNLTGHTGVIQWSIDLLSDSQTLVSGSWDRKIKTWNLTTGECSNTFNTGLIINSLTVLTKRTSKNLIFLSFQKIIFIIF
jgi:WD40 repeat protein